MLRPIVRLVVAVSVALVGSCAGAARIGEIPPHARAPSPVASEPPSADPAPPVAPTMDDGRFDEVDRAVRRAIAAGEVPGAVVVVARRSGVVFRGAWGSRAPGEPMTVDTVFDLASLTKPIATAASIVHLVDEHRLALDERAARFLPELRGTSAETITIAELLLHTAGLEPDDPLADYDHGEDAAIRAIAGRPLVRAPGERFSYSDVGFVLLGAIVERASGERLDAFARRTIFAPCGMKDATFSPPAELAPRIAPTEALRGVVHDPRARRLGGVAGHAGVFATADDVAAFARMLLGEGEIDGRRVLSTAAARAMTTPRDVGNGRRGLGLDIDTGYSPAVRGDVIRGGFGHTGFTGTSFWADPERDVAVVVLASRLAVEHGDVRRLRREVANAVARGVDGRVRVGIDVLEDDRFRELAGAKIALLANDAARDGNGTRTADVLAHAPGVRLVRLLAPEHGVSASVEGSGRANLDPATSVPIVPLYGRSLRADDPSFDGVDAVVVDLQDAGARYYTFAATVGAVVEAAGARKIPVVVLDRPNPVASLGIDGPLPDEPFRSLVAFADVPILHGLTLGELALLVARDRASPTDVRVVRMTGWRRSMSFADTGLAWRPPSPALRTAVEAMLYAGVAMVEGADVSVGRGTEAPFEVVGAPWIDGERLARDLASSGLDGLSFAPTSFTPTRAKHAGAECRGVRIRVVDARAVAPVRLGVALASALLRQPGGHVSIEALRPLVASRATLDALARGESLPAIAAGWSDGLTSFRARAEAVELYR